MAKHGGAEGVQTKGPKSSSGSVGSVGGTTNTIKRGKKSSTCLDILGDDILEIQFAPMKMFKSSVLHLPLLDMEKNLKKVHNLLEFYVLQSHLLERIK